MQNTFEEQLNAVITEYESAFLQSKSYSEYEDISRVLSESQISELQTRCISAIERVSGSRSIYSIRAREVGKKEGVMYGHVAKQIGVAKGLLYDIQNGHLKSLEEIIHGDLFSDFLEMASHLVEQGYKDPAAVMAGSTLEIHLRKLCVKNDIDILKEDGKPKKADSLNAELARAGVYEKLDQKGVTAWLDLRNKAAHGEYDEYTKEQVELLIENVRNFIIRHSA